MGEVGELKVCEVRVNHQTLPHCHCVEVCQRARLSWNGIGWGI